MSRTIASSISVTIWALLSLVPTLAQEPGEPITEVLQDSRQITWEPLQVYGGVTLRVLDAVGVIAEQTFARDQKISFDLGGLADGPYRWELIADPIVPQSVSQGMSTAAVQGQLREYSDDAKRRGDIPRHPVTQSGSFTVTGGLGVLPNLLEDGSDLKFRLVINENQIVKGRLCVGTNCPDNPEFGLSTILVMANTARLKFDDTSSTGSFPDNDWELTINDSSNGGVEKFAVKDCGVSSGGGCEGNEVFTVVAGAPNGALYVDSGGKVGLKTTSPVAELHILDADSPTIRLDQQGGPLAAQSWDLAGDNANLFVRDVTGGGSTPFKVLAGGATDTLVVGTSQRVGIGTSSPSAKLHIDAVDDSTVDNNTTALFVQNRSTVVANRAMLQLINNGGAAIFYEDTSSSLRWQTIASGRDFLVSRLGSGGVEFTLDDTGNLEITGTLTQGSDRSSKRDIEPVDVDDVLQRVAAMPISTWSYKKDGSGIRHLGPMAQDFHAAFGLGSDERRIATLDTSGVALAAVQALLGRIEELESQLDRVQAELESVREHH